MELTINDALFVCCAVDLSGAVRSLAKVGLKEVFGSVLG